MPQTVKARVRPPIVDIACPVCGKPMNSNCELFQCDNADCDEVGALYKVELPTIDVNLERLS